MPEKLEKESPSRSIRSMATNTLERTDQREPRGTVFLATRRLW
jgi:hypothetical protein